MFLWDFFKKDKLAAKPGMPPVQPQMPRVPKKPVKAAPDDSAKRDEINALLAFEAGVQRDAQLLEFMHGASANLRFEAAQAVQGKEALQELVKRYTDKDRRVFKHAKDCLSAIQAREKKQSQFSELLAQYGRVQAAQPVEVSEFVQAEHDYEKLTKQFALTDDERSQVEDARSAIQTQLAAQNEVQRGWLALKDDLRKLQADASALDPQAVTDAVAQVMAKTTTLESSAVTAKLAREVEALAQSIDKQAQARAVQAEKLSARDALIAKAQRLNPEKIGQQDIDVLQDAWRSLPALDVAVVGQAERFSQALAKAKDAMHAAQEAQKERASKAREFFAEVKPKLEEALAQGHAQEAIKLHDKLVARREDLRFATGSLARELNALLEEAGKLKGWQRFTNVNKRDELIERAEKIAGAPLPPQLQETEIASLREQWRALDKELGGATDKQWDKFRAATNKAYEPVRAHKKTMAKVREHNASAKAGQIAEMKDLLAQVDWATVDWKAVEQLRREAWTRWRAAGPVNRKVAEKLSEQNAAVMKELDDRLADARAREQGRRTALTEQAAALQGKPFPAVMADIRALQERWNSERLGVILPRKLEEETWQAFRSALNSVFAKRDEKRRELESELQANLQAKQALVQELRDMQAETNPQMLESKLRDLASRWDATGRVPHAKADALNDAWRSALAAGKTALTALRNNAEKSAIEAARVASLASRANATPDQQQAKLQALLDLEIAAQADSPDQFRDERLKRQVALLAKSFQGERSDLGSLAKRVIAWHNLPGGDDSMDARLAVVLNKLR
jgi:DNA repair protein SbcC/Rad50